MAQPCLVVLMSPNPNPYLILHLVSAHDDGLGCLGRRTLANKQTGQPNWTADEKYDQVRIVEIAIQ